MAGILYVLISPEWVERHLGGRGILPVVKSALFGVPLPLCSCGVIPVAVSIRRHGAGRGATTAFLLSTPQTGVDSILATWALLGPVFAIFRPVVAFVTGVVGGLLVSLFERPSRATQQSALCSALRSFGRAVSQSSIGPLGIRRTVRCTANKVSAGDPPNGAAAGEQSSGAQERCTDECCAEEPKGRPIARALRYGFMTLPQDIAKSLLVGIAVAALITVLVPKGALAPYLGNRLLAMLVMMAIGTPMYVCSTASIPIALGFVHMGVSWGAALVFLVTGPATNAATISVVWKLLGRRTGIIYLATVALGALAAGFALDLLFAAIGQPALSAVEHHHVEGAAGWFGHAAAVALLVVLVGSMVERRPAAPQG
jgi:hypothetical protein